MFERQKKDSLVCSFENINTLKYPEGMSAGRSVVKCLHELHLVSNIHIHT